MQERFLSNFYIRWIGISLVGIVAVIFLLAIFGNLFLSEISQEVDIGGKIDVTAQIQINERAIPVELSDMAGQSVSLSDFLGKPLVVLFWVTWNPHAADQVKIFDDYLASHGEELFAIVSINNLEDKSTVTNFMRRGGYQIRVLLDENGMVGERYQTRNLPATYFIDKDGIVRDIFVGVLSEEVLMQKALRLLQ